MIKSLNIFRNKNIVAEIFRIQLLQNYTIDHVSNLMAMETYQKNRKLPTIYSKLITLPLIHFKIIHPLIKHIKTPSNSQKEQKLIIKTNNKGLEGSFLDGLMIQLLRLLKMN